MEPFVVTVPHSLGREEALRRMKPVLSEAVQSFPILRLEEEVWAGDRMDFRVKALGQSIAGSINVLDNAVRIEAMIPWLLSKFGGAVQQTIADRATVVLGPRQNADT